MMDINFFILASIQTAILIILIPFFDGLTSNIESWLQSRKGSSTFQSYLDIIKLFRRSETMPENATWFFKWSPYLMFGVSCTMFAIIPIMYSNTEYGIVSDLFMFIYLAALLRFIFGVASLDSGSPFAAIGASREQMLAVFVEPALMLAAIVIALLAKSTNLVVIMHEVSSGKIGYLVPGFAIAAVAFLWATYVETGNCPYDLPEAEQEVQEGLLSEYSGKRLAIAHFALLVKKAAVIGLFITFFFPWPAVNNPFISLCFFLLKLGVFHVLATFVKAVCSRYRLLQVRKPATGALALATLSLIFYAIGG
jgi:hydrogenase-4 component C